MLATKKNGKREKLVEIAYILNKYEPTQKDLIDFIMDEIILVEKKNKCYKLSPPPP